MYEKKIDLKDRKPYPPLPTYFSNNSSSSSNSTGFTRSSNEQSQSNCNSNPSSKSNGSLNSSPNGENNTTDGSICTNNYDIGNDYKKQQDLENSIKPENFEKLVASIFEMADKANQEHKQIINLSSNETESETKVTPYLKFRHTLISNLCKFVPISYLNSFCKSNGYKNFPLYACSKEDCYNVYQSKGSLRRHEYTHTGERPYLCRFPNCYKSYVTSDRLAEHLNSHTNLRPYKCDYSDCSKAYNDPKTLREHKRTHGQKMFHCENKSCNKSFHRKTHLKQHLRVHKPKKEGTQYSDISDIQPNGNNENVFRSLLNDNDSCHFHVGNKD